MCNNFNVSNQIPNVEHAFIDPRKLRAYALDANHDTGKYKAEFFAQMGYTQGEWQILEQDIREQHLTQSAELGKQSAFGAKYTITAPLRGPNGEIRNVTPVWILRPNKAYCELVTIEPAKRLR